MKKISALLLTFLLTLFFTLSYFPSTSYAVSGTISLDGTYDVSSYGDNSVITIQAGLDVVLTNTGGNTYSDLQIVCEGANTQLTISNISILGSKFFTESMLTFTGEGNTLTLEGDSTVEAGYMGAGVLVESGTELTINGTGSLSVYGERYCAAIGSESGNDCGTVTIDNGTINAYGGEWGAGIGGGLNGTGGTVTINGGNVTAVGYNGSAGIGGGYNKGMDAITINGGTVSAKGYRGGAGIGTGATTSDTSDLGSITITDGDVTAVSSGYVTSDNEIVGGAAIGTGVYQYNIGTEGQVVNICDITIEEGNITATAQNSGAGIGSGSIYQIDGSDTSEPAALDGTISITGGTVTATGGTNSAGIGGGTGAGSCEIIIILASVTAYGGENGAGIGGGKNGYSGDTISIKGGTVYAYGGQGAAGIGGGYDTPGTEVLIGDSDVFAQMGEAGAYDIGAGAGGGLGSDHYIKDGAKVFLANDLIETPLNTTLSHFDMTGADIIFIEWGIKLPVEWTGAAGYAELTTYSVSYDINGAAGTTPDTDYLNLTSEVTLPDSSGLANGSLVLKNWNTNSAGTGTEYTPGGTYDFYSDTLLYAIWGDIDVTSVTLDIDSLSLARGESYKLTAAVLPLDTTKGELTWSSSDENVAVVNSDGWVTAISDGTCTIEAEADGISDTCAVTVDKKAVTSVSLDYSSKSLYIGDITTLTATVYPTDATYPTVTWESSDTSVATVTYGMVQAVGEGSCIITAKADGVSAACSVYVGRKAVTSVDLSYSSLSMYVDDQRVLTADVSPSDASDPDVTWKSSNTSVATVNSNGVITAISAGTATITATADGVSDTCSVTVNADAAVNVTKVGFMISSDTVTVMYVGDTLQLSVAVTPSDATDTSVTWASSDTSVITVSSSGKVTAVAEGDAKVTVTAKGNVSASYKVSVKSLADNEENQSESEEGTGEENQGASIDPTPEPTAAPSPTDAEIVLTFEIDTENLPYGSEYIQLPNGDIIELTGEDTLSVSVSQEHICDGCLELIALDGEKTALGSVGISSSEGTPFIVFILLALGALIAGAGGALLVVRVIVSKR